MVKCTCPFGRDCEHYIANTVGECGKRSGEIRFE